MDLVELHPRASKFHLKKIEKDLILRPWTIGDQAWLQQEYKENVQKIFDPANIDIAAICRIVYRLLDDKSDFKAEVIKTYNEDGDEIQEKVGGWKKLALSILDVNEQLDMFAAVTECIGLSMPEVDEIRNAGKKKEVKKQKKQTGQK